MILLSPGINCHRCPRFQIDLGVRGLGRVGLMRFIQVKAHRLGEGVILRIFAGHVHRHRRGHGDLVAPLIGAGDVTEKGHKHSAIAATRD